MEVNTYLNPANAWKWILFYQNQLNLALFYTEMYSRFNCLRFIRHILKTL